MTLSLGDSWLAIRRPRHQHERRVLAWFDMGMRVINSSSGITTSSTYQVYPLLLIFSARTFEADGELHDACTECQRTMPPSHIPFTVFILLILGESLRNLCGKVVWDILNLHRIQRGFSYPKDSFSPMLECSGTATDYAGHNICLSHVIM